MSIDDHLEGLDGRERDARRLIYTSVQDCQGSLAHIHDLPFLEEVLVRLEGMEDQASRRAVVERRIRQLRKSAQNARPEGCG